MGVTADKVVVELYADLDKAKADVRGYAGDFERQMERVEDATKRHDRGVKGAAVSLRALTGAGAAATVVVGGLVAAFNNARDAMSFAREVKTSADALGIGVEALQEYRHALEDAGGDAKKFDGALASLRQRLGEAASGLSPESLKEFKSLGFTQEQLRSFKTVEDLLPELAQRFSELKSPAEQAAIAAALGFEALIPLLSKGADEIARLREEARSLGVVMEREMIERAAESAKRFEALSKVIDIQLKSAFVDLAPAIVDLIELAAELATALADVADNFKELENRRTSKLQKERELRVAQINDAIKREPGAAFAKRGSVRDFIDRANARIEAIDKELASQSAADTETTTSTGNRTLTPPAKKAREQRDTTAERTAQVEAAIAAATQSALQATLALATNVRERARLQRQILEQEEAARSAQLAKQIADIEDDKGLSAPKKAQLTRELEKVRDQNAEAAKQRRAAVDQEERAGLVKEELALKLQTLDGEAALLTLQAQLTISAKAQQAIAKRLADIAYLREKASLDALIATEGVADAEKAVARARLATLEKERPLRQQAAGVSQEATAAQGIASDIIRADTLEERTAAMYAEIDRLRQEDVLSEEQAQRAKAEIAYRYNSERLANTQSFFGTLAGLANSENKKLAAIGKAAAIAQATIDGVLAVQKALASAPPPANYALAAAVGAVAAANVAAIVSSGGGRWMGGHVVGGTAYPVNEKGHLEAFVAPQSGKIIPLGNLKAEQRSAGGVTVVQPLHFHAQGAVLTPQLLAQANAFAQQAAAGAAAQAYQAALSAMPARIDQHQRLGA